jgi:hypothetical protein
MVGETFDRFAKLGHTASFGRERAFLYLLMSMKASEQLFTGRSTMFFHM